MKPSPRMCPGSNHIVKARAVGGMVSCPKCGRLCVLLRNGTVAQHYKEENK